MVPEPTENVKTISSSKEKYTARVTNYISSLISAYKEIR